MVFEFFFQNDLIYVVAFGKPKADHFRHRLIEGKVYILKNFQVCRMVDPYRVVSNDLYISLKFVTIVEPVDSIEDSIKYHSFDFIPFEQLNRRLNINKYLTGISSNLFKYHIKFLNFHIPSNLHVYKSIDVIGYLTSIGDTTNVTTKFGRKNIRTLQIKNEKYGFLYS